MPGRRIGCDEKQALGEETAKEGIYRTEWNIWCMAGCWGLGVQEVLTVSVPGKPGISSLRIWTLSVGNGSH